MTAARSTPLLFAEQYHSVAAALPGHGSPLIKGMRDRAVERARRLGAPTPRVERWKYTNLQPLLQTDFMPAARTVPAARVALPDLPGHRIVFCNGRLLHDLSTLGDLPDGVTVESLAELMAERPDEVAPWLEGDAEDGLAALNAAFTADGCRIRLGAGVRLERPIILVHLGDAASGSVAFHPRHVVLADRDSRGAVLELHEGSDGAYWSNRVATIQVGERAELRHICLIEDGPQAFQIGRSAVQVGPAGHYDSFVLMAAGRLVRNEIRVILAGEGASCRLAGAYLARGRQHCDATTEIVHAAPRTESREVYKGVLDDQARGVFQGRIVVEKDAQKSDGHQLNKTLLLSDRAEIDTKPELEIHADDVKCSHGAAAGELDEDALFYLRARGIAAAEARRLLVGAFLGEVLDEIANGPMRGLVERRIAAWLGSPYGEEAP